MQELVDKLLLLDQN